MIVNLTLTDTPTGIRVNVEYSPTTHGPVGAESLAGYVTARLIQQLGLDHRRGTLRLEAPQFAQELGL